MAQNITHGVTFELMSIENVLGSQREYLKDRSECSSDSTPIYFISPHRDFGVVKLVCN